MCVKLLGEENDREKREVEECRSHKAQGMGMQNSAGGSSWLLQGAKEMTKTLLPRMVSCGLLID